jgi:hypothetical protein
VTHGLGGWDEGLASRVDPLVYPGRWPPQSVLLTDTGLLPLHPLPGRRIGQALVDLRHDSRAGDDSQALDEVPLDDLLRRSDATPTDDRVPVLAVGSNASPAQIRHKYAVDGTSMLTPLVKARVDGLGVGLAPAVAGGGYVPATPIVGPGLSSELFVHWLDAAQLVQLDLTEIRYHRILLRPGDPAKGGVRVTLPSGEELGACYVYASAGGHLTVASGNDRPLELTDQRIVLETLLAAAPRLRELAGETPESWVERCRADRDLRTLLAAAFVHERLVGRNEILGRLVAEQEAPLGGPVDPDAGPRPYALPYGRIPPAVLVPDEARPVVPPHSPIN